MRLNGFRDHVKYDEDSFEQSVHLSFDAMDANNSQIYFDVKTPQGSVMLTDPTLEITIDLALKLPY
jgi:hypothetical protein